MLFLLHHLFSFQLQKFCTCYFFFNRESNNIKKLFITLVKLTAAGPIVQGVLRRNIEHFLKKVHIGKFRNFWNQITEKSCFFLFPIVCIFDFCKHPSLHFIFGLKIYDVNNEHCFENYQKRYEFEKTNKSNTRLVNKTKKIVFHIPEGIFSYTQYLLLLFCFYLRQVKIFVLCLFNLILIS